MKIILARHTDEETAERLRANAWHLLRSTPVDDHLELLDRFADLETDARWHRQSAATEAEAVRLKAECDASSRFTECHILPDPGVPLTADVVARLTSKSGYFILLTVAGGQRFDFDPVNGFSPYTDSNTIIGTDPIECAKEFARTTGRDDWRGKLELVRRIWDGEESEDTTCQTAWNDRPPQ